MQHDTVSQRFSLHERNWVIGFSRFFANLVSKTNDQAWLAQSVEHETLNLRVVGSSPTLGVFYLVSFSNSKLQVNNSLLLLIGLHKNKMHHKIACQKWDLNPRPRLRTRKCSASMNSLKSGALNRSAILTVADAVLLLSTQIATRECRHKKLANIIG